MNFNFVYSVSLLVFHLTLERHRVYIAFTISTKLNITNIEKRTRARRDDEVAVTMGGGDRYKNKIKRITDTFPNRLLTSLRYVHRATLSVFNVFANVAFVWPFGRVQ